MWDDLDRIVSAHDKGRKTHAETFADLGTPSISIAVLDGKGHILTRHYGDTDSSKTYQACSISKPIMGLAAMKLVDEGKLKLDAPITKYLPRSIIDALATPDTTELLSYVTVKQLLSHTSGLSQHGFPGYPSSIPSANMPSAVQILGGKTPVNTLKVSLTGMPGHRFAYSGGGMTVMQIVLEQICGEGFPTLMQRLVFDPLEMKSAHYGGAPEGEFAKAHHTGYQPYDASYYELPEMGAAGVWITPSDLTKTIIAMQQSLLGEDGKGFLKRDTAKQMLTEVSDSAALCWFAPKAPGTTFQHSGGNTGYRCHLMGYANLDEVEAPSSSEGRGIVVMTNSDEGYDAVLKTSQAIAYLERLPLPLVYGAFAIPFADPDAKIPENWKDWLGEWEGWTIVDVSGIPHVRFGSLPPVRLQRAAHPSHKSGDFTAIDLVLDGLQLMLRLTMDKEDHVVELWHGAKTDVKTLKRE